MNDVNIHTTLKEQFKKLPPKLQEAITSTEIAEKLRAIAQKHRLHIDQGQILENETYMVLLGIEQAGAYEKNLQKELTIPTEVAQKIYTDVAKDIFLVIRDTLKEATTTEKPTQVPDPEAQTVHAQETSPFTTNTDTAHNKLESVVRKQSKDFEISPRKTYTTDPYRESIE
ncbi:MAG: hypothetical protein WD509_01275 [Candidatus Paceibacterota bacterium]